MSNILKLAIFLTMLMPLSTSASTGDLRGACKKAAFNFFPDAELIGMLGGTMENYNVSGYFTDLNDNTVYEFFCYFPTSHHDKPVHFLLHPFATSDEDPISSARQTFERLNERSNARVKNRLEMEKAAKDAATAAKNNEKPVH